MDWIRLSPPGRVFGDPAHERMSSHLVRTAVRVNLMSELVRKKHPTLGKDFLRVGIIEAICFLGELNINKYERERIFKNEPETVLF